MSMINPPAKRKVSSEFKLLLATSQLEKSRPDMCCEQHPEKYWPHDDCAGPGMPPLVQTPDMFAAAGKPSPLTIITFKDKKNADIAFDALTAYNTGAPQIAITAIKLY